MILALVSKKASSLSKYSTKSPCSWIFSFASWPPHLPPIFGPTCCVVAIPIPSLGDENEPKRRRDKKNHPALYVLRHAPHGAIVRGWIETKRTNIVNGFHLGKGIRTPDSGRQKSGHTPPPQPQTNQSINQSINCFCCSSGVVVACCLGKEYTATTQKRIVWTQFRRTGDCFRKAL
jgi:hypothetical protein